MPDKKIKEIDLRDLKMEGKLSTDEAKELLNKERQARIQKGTEIMQKAMKELDDLGLVFDLDGMRYNHQGGFVPIFNIFSKS